MEYSINESTLAVIPTENLKCRIIEGKKSYTLNNKSFKVIEHSCEYFGVSYKARLEGSKKFINARYKSPIIIEDASRIVFFPITSPSRNNAWWISFNNVKDYYSSSTKSKSTVIKFKNGYKLVLPVSYYSFNNQYLKAAHLNMLLTERLLKNH